MVLAGHLHLRHWHLTPTIMAAMALAPAPASSPRTWERPRARQRSICSWLWLHTGDCAGPLRQRLRCRSWASWHGAGSAHGGCLVIVSGSIGGHMGMIFGGFMVFNAFMNMGPNATTYLLSGETFPTSIRLRVRDLRRRWPSSERCWNVLLPLTQGGVWHPALLIVLAIAGPGGQRHLRFPRGYPGLVGRSARPTT